MGIDPISGNVLVGDLNNSRIDEFTAWGEFVKAWGWDVAPEGAPGDTAANQLEVCTTSCQVGAAGSGAGQLDEPLGVAVDSTGAVYVYEIANHRVEKFDSEGSFVWMAGGGVDQGPVHPGNLCTATYITEGDTCGAGSAGAGNGQFSNAEYGNYLAIGPEGHLFVGDVGRIEEFNEGGGFEGQIEGKVAGKTIGALAMDTAGNFYVAFASEPNVYKLNSSGAEVASFPVPAFAGEGPHTVAVDGEGDLYAVASGTAKTATPKHPYVIEYDAAGNQLIPTTEEEAEAKAANERTEFYEYFPKLNGILNGLATSKACWEAGSKRSDLYVGRFEFSTSDLHAYGPAPEESKCPHLKEAPTITAQYATRVTTDSAKLQAQINPHLAETTYYVEYGVGSCEAGECGAKLPFPAGVLGQIVNSPVASKDVLLPELVPATTYHFRFVAENAGGGPVYGVAPEGGEASEEEGLEGTFTTPVPPPALGPDNCSNAQFRSGAGAYLPDCRGYEMVSPVDKNGADILTLFNEQNLPAAYEQATPEGEGLTYSAYRAFGDAQSAPFTSQYIASRDPATGWSSEGISPSRTLGLHGSALEVEYLGFSADLCSGWLLHDTDPVLAAGAVEGFPNLYRRSDCGAGAGGYEAITTKEPPSEASSYAPDIQGTSADGSLAAFRAPDSLAVDEGPAAAAGSNYQCYEMNEGKLRLISVLPGGAANATNCSVGTANSVAGIGLRTADVRNAVSTTGGRIYWTAGPAAGPGQVYLREGSSETIAVSKAGEEASGKSGSQFWTASPDGARALYSVGGLEGGEADLYEFNAASKESRPVAHRVRGVLGASEDVQRVYFVSEEEIAGAGGGVAGKPNLYLAQAGVPTRFIATVSAADAKLAVALKEVTPVAAEPLKHTAQVTPSGAQAVFMSTASLKGYDNTDAASGQADAEVYRYDAIANGGAGQLSCISCNPSGARPNGRPLLAEGGGPGWAAAQITRPETQLYAPRVISDDGQRVFFETAEALVVRDSNEAQDVYEWEAPGAGTCTLPAYSYSPPTEGCIALISSGQSSQDSRFVDASADGRDAFFATGQSLVQQDPSLVDIYDAREFGGFPPPAQPAEPCQGEACQSPSSAPEDQSPASSTYRGPGNSKAKDNGCSKGKHRVKSKGKVRCVKNKGKKVKRGAA